MATTNPLPTPLGVNPSSDYVAVGIPIPPIERIRIFSAGQWEDFVLEWADSLRAKYSNVERCAGAGDMGRDVIAFDTADPALWDNFQCKHYDTGLTPTDVWVELGKLVYYTYINQYTYPRRYFFVAPQGAGTKLSNLLKKPDVLKAQLKKNWEAYCKSQITSKNKILLDSHLEAHLDSLDFSIFEAIQPLRLIDQHAQTRWHATRFGGGLPSRPKFAPPPATMASHEVDYVRRLLDAYADHLKCEISVVTDLVAYAHIDEHFQDARLEFYSAEALRSFSRDTLPPGAFEDLQADLHSGIKDEIRGIHADGYRRVLAVVRTAKLLPITAHALKERLSTMDKGGICHQLANDGKVKWIK